MAAPSVAILAATTLAIVAVVAITVAAGALVPLDTLNLTRVQLATQDGTTGRAIGILHTGAAIWMMAGVLVPTLLVLLVGVQAAVAVVALAVAALGIASVTLVPARTPVLVG